MILMTAKLTCELLRPVIPANSIRVHSASTTWTTRGVSTALSIAKDPRTPMLSVKLSVVHCLS